MYKCMCLYPIVKKTFYCLIPVITIYKYNDSISINAYLNPHTFPSGIAPSSLYGKLIYFWYIVNDIHKRVSEKLFALVVNCWGENFLVFFVFLAGCSFNIYFVGGYEGFILFWLWIPREYMRLKFYLFIYVPLIVYLWSFFVLTNSLQLKLFRYTTVQLYWL